jgi:hypothetical protein
LNIELRTFAMPEVDEHDQLVDVSHSGIALLAMIVNQPISTQIRTLLIFLASFLARQELTSGMRSGTGGIRDIDSLAQRADELAAQQVDEYLRQGDWVQTAAHLSERARNDGYALEVAFAEPVLQPEEIRRRVRVLRRVYNEVPSVRDTIDRVAGAMSHSMYLSGEGVPPAIMREAQRVIDMSTLRRFLAHHIRDTFVCGNGYLCIGNGRTSTTKLLPPERVRHLGNESYELKDSVSGEWVKVNEPVVHLAGAKQVGSDYGVSLIEPFLQIASQNELLESAVQRVALTDPPADRVAEGADWIRDASELKERAFAESTVRVTELLGSATTNLRKVASADLYFPGQELMRDAASSLSYRSPGGPAGEHQ